MLAEDDRIIADYAAAYDLVILDLGLPKLSGQDVLRRLRACKSNLSVLAFAQTDRCALLNGEMLDLSAR